MHPYTIPPRRRPGERRRIYSTSVDNPKGQDGARRPPPDTALVPHRVRARLRLLPAVRWAAA